MSKINTAELIKKSIEDKRRKQEELNEFAQKQIIQRKLEDLEKKVAHQDKKIRILEEELAFAQNKTNDNANNIDGIKNEHNNFSEEIWKILDETIRPKINNCLEYRHKTREALLIIAKRLDEIPIDKKTTH